MFDRNPFRNADQDVMFVGSVLVITGGDAEERVVKLLLGVAQ